MTHRRSQRGPRVVTSEFKLPFTARWGDQTLPPGKYDVFFVENEPSPVIVIRGMQITAIVAPTQVEEHGKAKLSTLSLSPGFHPPHVQALRLASAGRNLYFQETFDARPGVLTLLLRENAPAACTRPRA